MQTSRLRPLGALLLVLGLGCSTTPMSERLDGLMAEDAREQREAVLPSDWERHEANHQRRLDQVAGWAQGGRIEEPLDQLRAAELLVDSDHEENIALAGTLAEHAAEAGLVEALPLIAEATDRMLLKQGLPQRYGTQYVFDPAAERWTLYRWNRETTDEERQQMGVPTLSQAIAREAILNGY